MGFTFTSSSPKTCIFGLPKPTDRMFSFSAAVPDRPPSLVARPVAFPIAPSGFRAPCVCVGSDFKPPMAFLDPRELCFLCRSVGERAARTSFLLLLVAVAAAEGESWYTGKRAPFFFKTGIVV